jgi:acyl-coenzyme A synthetase/AMP-(fatty) acid ligase
MVGYRGDGERTAESMRDDAYHTGDIASRDARGYITYVGRADDVFKASDYRISPFELESVLIEHPAVADREGGVFRDPGDWGTELDGKGARPGPVEMHRTH